MSARAPDLSRWLEYTETLNPALIDLGLERLRPVARRLGIARMAAPVISVAGTNGKGSTVAFLEALATSHGLRVAAYGSPHLLHYGECVRLDGNAQSDAALIGAFEAVEAVREGVPLTAFEFRTLAAIHQLRQLQPDLLVLEVGLGGRLDAVNILDADVAVVSAIGLDHRQWLGDTLQQVAAEKCGIARPGRPLVCAHGESIGVVQRESERRGARLFGPGHGLELEVGESAWSVSLQGRHMGPLPFPDLQGAHQIGNAAGAIAAFCLALGASRVDHAAVIHALGQVDLPGRLQRIRAQPLCIVDVAHNAQACAALASWMLHSRATAAWRGVCAMYRDKDARACMAALAPCIEEWFLASLPGPRGATAARLGQLLEDVSPNARAACFPDVERAWRAAVPRDAAQCAVIGFGSFETVRRILTLESSTG